MKKTFFAIIAIAALSAASVSAAVTITPATSSGLEAAFTASADAWPGSVRVTLSTSIEGQPSQPGRWGGNEMSGSRAWRATSESLAEIGVWARPVAGGVDLVVRVTNWGRNNLEQVRAGICLEVDNAKYTPEPASAGMPVVRLVSEDGRRVVLAALENAESADSPGCLRTSAGPVIAQYQEALFRGRLYFLNNDEVEIEAALQADLGKGGRLTQAAADRAKRMRKPRIILNPSNQFGNVIRGEGREQLYNEGMNMYLVAMAAKKYLEADGRMDVYVTRDSQTQTTELWEEARVANALKCDALVALHSDATGNNTPGGGTWTFYTAPSRLRPGEIDHFPYPIEKSKQLADLVQSNVVAAIREVYPEVEDRGTKEHWYRLYMVHRPQCPSCLIEVLFHTNPKERELLKQPDFQDRVGHAIARAVAEFFFGR